MQFLIIGEAEVNPPLPPRETAQFFESLIIPSLEAIVQMEKEKKIVGGVYAGSRAAAFIVEAISNEEVSHLLMGLPFWALFKWKVTPLESTQSRLNTIRQMVERLKAASA